MNIHRPIQKSSNQTMLLAELILISSARSTQTIMVWGAFFGSLCRVSEIQNCFLARDWFWSTRLLSCLLVIGIATSPPVNKLAATLLAYPATPPDLSLLSTATYAMEQDSILAIIQFHSWNPLQFEANSSSDSSQGILKKGDFLLK